MTANSADPGGGANQNPASTVSHEQSAYDELSFTLHMRPASSTAVERRQNRIHEQFSQLVDAETIEDIEMNRWQQKIQVPVESPSQRRAVELFDEFRKKTLQVGGRLEPFFEERSSVSTFFTKESTERILIFPVLCVTVRDDDELVGLYPCWRDATHHSVGDCLDRLKRGEPVCNLD